MGPAPSTSPKARAVADCATSRRSPTTRPWVPSSSTLQRGRMGLLLQRRHVGSGKITLPERTCRPRPPRAGPSTHGLAAPAGAAHHQQALNAADRSARFRLPDTTAVPCGSSTPAPVRPPSGSRPATGKATDHRQGDASAIGTLVDRAHATCHLARLGRGLPRYLSRSQPVPQAAPAERNPISPRGFPSRYADGSPQAFRKSRGQSAAASPGEIERPTGWISLHCSIRTTAVIRGTRATHMNGQRNHVRPRHSEESQFLEVKVPPVGRRTKTEPASENEGWGKLFFFPHARCFRTDASSSVPAGATCHPRGSITPFG